jgi:hypothetical protein
VIVPVPENKKIVTSTPRNIVPCEPTQVELALTISPGTPDAWLSVVGTRVISAYKPELPPTIFPLRGDVLSERLGRLNLVVPNEATVYLGTFMYSGDQSAVDLALTPRSESLMLLHHWVKQVTAEMDMLPPTVEDILDLADDLATVPALTRALGRFTSIPVPASGNGPIYDPLGLLPSLDVAASQAGSDLSGIRFSDTDLNAFGALLEKHLGHLVTPGLLAEAVEKVGQQSRILGPLRGQLALLLPSQNDPVSITFISGRSEPTTPVPR